MNRLTTVLALVASLALRAGGAGFEGESALQDELAQTREQLWQAREQLWQARNDLLEKNRQIDELRAAATARPEDGGLGQERVRHLEDALDSIAKAFKSSDLLPADVRSGIAFSGDDPTPMEGQAQLLATAAGVIVQTGNAFRAEHGKILEDLQQSQLSLQCNKEALTAAHARNVQLQGDLADKDARLRELQATIAALEEEKARLAAQLEKFAAEQAAAPALPPNTQGKIVGVNPDWSFVIVDIGASQGAFHGAELLVSRGETFLGRIRLIDIRDDVSTAELLPGTEISNIQEGDDVLF